MQHPHQGQYSFRVEIPDRSLVVNPPVMACDFEMMDGKLVVTKPKAYEPFTDHEGDAMPDSYSNWASDAHPSF